MHRTCVHAVRATHTITRTRTHLCGPSSRYVLPLPLDRSGGGSGSSAAHAARHASRSSADDTSLHSRRCTACKHAHMRAHTCAHTHVHGAQLQSGAGVEGTQRRHTSGHRQGALTPPRSLTELR